MRVTQVRDYSKRGDALPIPNLIDVQTAAYKRFPQAETLPEKRKSEGLEALLREVFPIESYDGNMKLEYLSYDLGKPRYTQDECRALRLTFGMPFRVRVRLSRKDKPDLLDEAIYLGELAQNPLHVGDGPLTILEMNPRFLDQSTRGEDFASAAQDDVVVLTE